MYLMGMKISTGGDLDGKLTIEHVVNWGDVAQMRA
jgi:hypothetical protein